MQTKVLLPQVELTMESAVIAKWLVAEGDRVNADQPLLEVETQKATSEVPSPAAGYVRKLCVKEGDTVEGKALLCVLTDTADEPLDEQPTLRPSPLPSPGVPREGESTSPSGQGDALKASPAARRVAKELGVDLATVKATGPGGRITEDDVRAASTASTSQAAGADASGEWKPLPPTRLALIAQMQKSLAEIPQIHLQRQLVVTPLTIKAEGITFTHRLIVAVASALRRHPALRTIINGDRIKVAPVSVAIAMDSPHGLIAPVVRQADQLSLQQVAALVKELKGKAQVNTLRRDELIDAPFAISNLGMLEVDQFDAFVFHGQTAVLSVGRSVDASGGRKLAWFGLAADHRVVDGAEGARFLQTLQTEILR